MTILIPNECLVSGTDIVRTYPPICFAKVAELATPVVKDSFVSVIGWIWMPFYVDIAIPQIVVAVCIFIGYTRPRNTPPRRIYAQIDEEGRKIRYTA